MPNTAYAFEEEIEVAESESLAEIDDSESLATAAERERLALIEEVRLSVEHYKRTGLHVTWDEMEAWLETWGTDHETPPPESHT